MPDFNTKNELFCTININCLVNFFIPKKEILQSESFRGSIECVLNAFNFVTRAQKVIKIFIVEKLFCIISLFSEVLNDK